MQQPVRIYTGGLFRNCLYAAISIRTQSPTSPFELVSPYVERLHNSDISAMDSITPSQSASQAASRPKTRRRRTSDSGQKRSRRGSTDSGSTQPGRCSCGAQLHASPGSRRRKRRSSGDSSAEKVAAVPPISEVPFSEVPVSEDPETEAPIPDVADGVEDVGLGATEMRGGSSASDDGQYMCTFGYSSACGVGFPGRKLSAPARPASPVTGFASDYRYFSLEELEGADKLTSG
ncbi:hypothetical protein EJ06DRAFT_521971 [Trichodelitschia bisporula]|uniref:Uncharacterized protein n=1 Tax=Trichodelitschia bisporula TaxID=703511 RepID=A0A6G1HX85_9PEZI|nr:hypothetical protein EJ06DRAFT_521971 [Trichodelitschia bisporula]